MEMADDKEIVKYDMNLLYHCICWMQLQKLHIAMLKIMAFTAASGIPHSHLANGLLVQATSVSLSISKKMSL